MTSSTTRAMPCWRDSFIASSRKASLGGTMPMRLGRRSSKMAANCFGFSLTVSRSAATSLKATTSVSASVPAGMPRSALAPMVGNSESPNRGKNH